MTEPQQAGEFDACLNPAKEWLDIWSKKRRLGATEKLAQLLADTYAAGRAASGVQPLWPCLACGGEGGHREGCLGDLHIRERIKRATLAAPATAQLVTGDLTRCPVCKMPLSRPLCMESHLPNCWLREDLEKLTATAELSEKQVRKSICKSFVGIKINRQLRAALERHLLRELNALLRSQPVSGARKESEK